MRLHIFLGTSVLLTSGLLAFAHARVFTPEDLFRLEALAGAVPSPDDRTLAIVRVRAKSAAVMHMRTFMSGRDRSDIWIFDPKAAVAHKITNGDGDGAGFFSPVWSPNSEHLAFLSTRGNNITLWVWRQSTRELRQVSQQTVETGSPVWVSDREVVCAAPPEGEQPGPFDLEVRASMKAATIWPKAWSGAAVTASVLASGPGLRTYRPPRGRLLKFDVFTGKSRTIADGSFTAISTSTDGRIAAFEAADFVRPEPGARLANRNYSKYRLVVFENGRKKTAAELTDTEEPSVGPVAWFQNGVAVRINGLSSRPGWFLVQRDGKRINLTAELSTVPPLLVADGEEVLGVTDGRLWRIRSDGFASEVLFGERTVRIDSLLTSKVPSLVLRGQVNGKSGIYELDLRTSEFRPIQEPGEPADFVTFMSGSATAVFSGSNRSGTFLWTTHPGRSGQQVVMTLNGFCKDIAEARWKMLPYRTVEGRELTAWLMLPPDHLEGKRHRTVVTVYPGLVYSTGSPPVGSSIQSTSPYNLQLLAARGYAVLFPSIPLTPEGQPGEPYRQTAEGVLPAIDQAIKAGIADSDRLALIGHSFGGYGVYTLLTQDSRFKAAIAMGGFANLVSLYGQFDPRARYEPYARDRLIHMMFAESGQFRMGVPPWKDMDRYVRNSPISFVDRVETPVMIVQGDQDYVPIQQGEEFFTALYRQNKSAIFVRYWGEGHILESPANISDLWRRIYEWLDRYLPE
ncbi:MAG: S9 family peptidase [Bryobacteraceae bacterium]|nr:prolyl oligopeptidase family serine peptidase [Bryobacterales bacterium]NUM99540.1 S9 family peptidase [Bryobacteraceae bacterium]